MTKRAKIWGADPDSPLTSLLFSAPFLVFLAFPVVVAVRIGLHTVAGMLLLIETMLLAIVYCVSWLMNPVASRIRRGSSAFWATTLGLLALQSDAAAGDRDRPGRRVDERRRHQAQGDAPRSSASRAPSTLAAHIIREGVTNALKHAVPSWVAIELTDAGVRVTNDGVSAAQTRASLPSGAGLAGLQERVADAGRVCWGSAASGDEWTLELVLADVLVEFEGGRDAVPHPGRALESGGGDG